MHSAMLIWNCITSNDSGGGEDCDSEWRQRDHVGVLLAEQPVENELAQESNPGRALSCSGRPCLVLLPHKATLAASATSTQSTPAAALMPLLMLLCYCRCYCPDASVPLI